MMITREIFLGLVSLPGIQLCGGSCVYVTKTVAKAAAPTARISSKILSCLLAKKSAPLSNSNLLVIGASCLVLGAGVCR